MQTFRAQLHEGQYTEARCRSTRAGGRLHEVPVSTRPHKELDVPVKTPRQCQLTPVSPTRSPPGLARRCRPSRTRLAPATDRDGGVAGLRLVPRIGWDGGPTCRWW